jgi:hypothetical protein
VAWRLDILQRSVSLFFSIHKFKDELTIPFTKPADRSELRDLAYGWISAWLKSWVFQVTVRTVPVPQPGTLGVRS